MKGLENRKRSPEMIEGIGPSAAERWKVCPGGPPAVHVRRLLALALACSASACAHAPVHPECDGFWVVGAAQFAPGLELYDENDEYVGTVRSVGMHTFDYDNTRELGVLIESHNGYTIWRKVRVADGYRARCRG